MAKENFLSSIYLIIKNEKGEILLQRRKGTKLWYGFLALPAGHVDLGENVYEAMMREAKEELGIEVRVSDIIDTFVVNRKNVSLPSDMITFEKEAIANNNKGIKFSVILADNEEKLVKMKSVNS